MRYAFNTSFHRLTCVALAAAGLAMASAPTLAQTVEEITVIGRRGPAGEVRELTRVVSYADLDLTTPDGADGLKTRVKDTAHALCGLLGETNTASSVVPSCERAAIDDAMKQVDTVIAAAAPRGVGATALLPETPASDASATVAADAPPPAATYTTRLVTNGPVADTPENRARYGAPLSRAGRNTAATGD